MAKVIITKPEGKNYIEIAYNDTCPTGRTDLVYPDDFRLIRTNDRDETVEVFDVHGLRTVFSVSEHKNAFQVTSVDGVKPKTAKALQKLIASLR